MPTNVKGSSLAVGDVIQDSAATSDTHPYVVVSRSQWHVTLRNCTSHETSALELIKVDKNDKTGDVGWAGKDSYVVKNSTTVDLAFYRDDSYVVNEPVSVPDGPPVPMQFMGPQGPYTQYMQPMVVIGTVPRVVQRYSDIVYRKVGTVKAERMAAVLEALAA